MRHYVAQRSREWFGLRIGKVTSTRMKTVAHGTLAAQTKLLDEMQAEVERPDEAIEKEMEGFGYATPRSIALGREREDWLIARYEIMQQHAGTPVVLDRPGIVTHDSIDEFADSPDWLTEIKVGEGKTRVDHTKHEYAIKHGLLAEDKDQIYCHAMCAGFLEADYVSYCPDYPEIDMRVVIVPLELDQIYMNHLYNELNSFLKHFRAGTRPTVPQFQSGVPSFFDEVD